MTFWNALAAVPHRCDLTTIDGVQTRVLEAGTGPATPVVCLHGVGGHLEAFGRNVAPLAARGRVVAYDLPGHGWSAGPPDRSYEIDGYVQHLRALLDAVGPGPVDLIGVSLGGWISARLAHDDPDRVRRLVLVGTGGATYDEQVMASITQLSSAAVADPSVENVRRRLEWLMADPATVTDELIEARRAIYSQPGFAERMERILCLQVPDIRRANLIGPDEWAALAAPTLVVWGAHDRTAPVSKGQEIAGMIPGGALLELPDAGHWPQYESADAFNTAIQRFLATKGCS